MKTTSPHKFVLAALVAAFFLTATSSLWPIIIGMPAIIIAVIITGIMMVPTITATFFGIIITVIGTTVAAPGFSSTSTKPPLG